MDSNHPVNQVERLRKLAFSTTIFRNSARAQHIWAHHAERLCPFPDTYVTADNCMSTVEGLVIGGSWDANGGWDLGVR